MNEMHTIAAIKIQLEGDGIHHVKMNKSPTDNTLANAKANVEEFLVLCVVNLINNHP